MGWTPCIGCPTSLVTLPLGGSFSTSKGMTEGAVITSFTRVLPVIGGGTSTCKRKKEKHVVEHHQMHKYTALEKNGSKQKKAQTEEGHTTSLPDDWLLPLLGSNLCLDCQKKKKKPFIS